MKYWSCLVIGLMVGGANASIVAGWDVEGVDVDSGIGVESNIPPFTFCSTTSDFINVSAALTLGDGGLRTTTIDQYGFKIPGVSQTNSLSGAISQDQFIEISITIDEGYELNLDSIEMKGQAAATGCSNVVLISSIDGYVAGNEIASATNANTTGGFDTDSSGFGQPIDLSAGKYQNLTGTVSFRLYGWDSTGGSGATYIRNLTGNDLEIFGEVVELPATGELFLSLESSNSMTFVNADFDGAVTTNYVLQSSTNLASNVWNTVSGTFSSDTNWIVEVTNGSSFYRAIVQ
jgi:hypothetical protein